MARDALPYRICAALAVLFGGVFLVVTFGHVGSLTDCAQNNSARVEAVIGGELETESLAMSLGTASSTARLSSYLPVSGSIPECGPGPAQNLGSSFARLVRLTEQDDWETQSTDPSGSDRAESLRRIAEDRRSGSPHFVSRAQGTLEAVRSVVLRL